MEISVIIPTFQEREYIGKLLSRLVRIENPIEVIVVDGGSTDGTVSEAKRFTKKVYEIHERGIAKARNYGAYKSSGEILVFLDADVIPPADFAETMQYVFQRTQVVGATCSIMPKNPRVSELVFFRFYNFLIRSTMLFEPHSRGEFLAVRRQHFLRIGGFNSQLPCLEDHDLAFRISKLGRFLYLPDLVVYESMRRFRKLGLSKVLKIWIVNYISLVLFKRTLSKSWEPVR